MHCTIKCDITEIRGGFALGSRHRELPCPRGSPERPTSVLSHETTIGTADDPCTDVCGFLRLLGVEGSLIVIEQNVRLTCDPAAVPGSEA